MVFIVIGFGAASGQWLPAVGGVAAPVVLTVAVGIAVTGPLSRVPENWIKDEHRSEECD